MRVQLRLEDAGGTTACTATLGWDTALATAAVPGMQVTGLQLGEVATASGMVTPGDTAAQGHAWDVRLTLTPHQDFLGRLTIAAQLPAVDPWWLIPGLFYGNNRPESCGRLFPRFEAGARAADLLLSDAWSFRADRAATPAVFAWGDAGAVALLVAGTSALGTPGLGFSYEAGVARVEVRFPFREEPVTYNGSATPRPPSQRAFQFRAGEPVDLVVRVYALSGDRYGYAPVLREVWEDTHLLHRLHPWMEADRAAELTAYGLWRWHYDPDPGLLVEELAFDPEIGAGRSTAERRSTHGSHVSSLAAAYALLRHGARVGNAEYVAAARCVIGFISSALSPSGTFYDTWHREGGWTGVAGSRPRAVDARTTGEATYYLVRAIALERTRAAGRASIPDAGARPGHNAAPSDTSPGAAIASWEAAVRSNVAHMVARQRPDGNLGAWHDYDTGDVLSWEGTGGLMWIPALIGAANTVASDPAEAAAWRAAAARAGSYYAQFVGTQHLRAAAEDGDLAPAARDGYAAIMAYMALHRAGASGAGAPGLQEAAASGTQGDAASWLEVARRAADWTLTFRYTYNVAFHQHTLLAQYGFTTRGADQAGPGDQYLQGDGLLCTRDLLELSVALGDPYYTSRAQETLDCFRQFIARHNGDFGAYRGMVPQRFYQTQCIQSPGMLHAVSCARSLGVMLLANEEVLGTRTPVSRWR